MKNFIRKDQFPYHTPTGWDYDSGDYHAAREGARRDRLRGPAQGAGREGRPASSWASASLVHRDRRRGASHDFDIIGIEMFDSAEIRVHPTGSAIVRLGVQSQGQGHETTFAQIVAERPRHPGQQGQGRGGRHGHGAVRPRHVRVTPRPPPAPRPPSPPARSARRPATSPRTCSSARPTTSSGRPASGASRAAPTGSRRSRRLAFCRLHQPSRRDGGRARGDRLLRPAQPHASRSAAYICVVDIDKGTGQVNVRRFVAIDDCGNIINPMIVDGQIHAASTMGLAPALYEEITYDEQGNNPRRDVHGLPPADGHGDARLGDRQDITPSPHHPLGAKGWGSRPRSAPRRRSPTRSSTPSPTSA